MNICAGPSAEQEIHAEAGDFECPNAHGNLEKTELECERRLNWNVN